MTRLKIIIEGLPVYAEKKDLGKVLSWCAETIDLSIIARWISLENDSFSIICYPGGNHLALHGKTTSGGMGERLAIITNT